LCVQELDVYLRGRAVLRGVALAARRGAVTAVLGPNGAGKTTLLKAMAGLCEAEGRLAWCGRDLRTMSRQERSRTVAYVPQRSSLEAPLMVWDVVALGRHPCRGAAWTHDATDHVAVERALRAVRAERLARRRYTQLSGGEQRRVIVARALATEAPVVLLDEPTASLDIAHALEVGARLRTLARSGRCIIAAMHQLDEVLRWADDAVLLSEGRLVRAGSVRDVLCRERIRSVYGVETIEGGALGYCLPHDGGRW
jgi:iron complex transport system ATP-binding protein